MGCFGWGADIQFLCGTQVPAGWICVSQDLCTEPRPLIGLGLITDHKAGFRSLGDAWADTTTAHGRLMGTVLGGLAEFERELIRARTGKGRARAKARASTWASPQTDRASEAGGYRAARERRAVDGDCPQLQCVAQQDFEAHDAGTRVGIDT